MAAVKLNANQTRIVESLFDNGPQTIKQIGDVFPQSLINMEDRGVIKRLKTTVKHTDENGNPQRGRPLTVWTLDKNTKARIKRARAAQDKVAA